MNKKTYRISLRGCDDSTIWIRNLTKKEVELLRELEKEADEISTYSCMPILKVEEINE